MKILAIETSCDETAAAIVEDGRKVLGSALYTQIAMHREFGGVVPELASRKHVEKLPYVVKSALESANAELKDMDAIAVTAGPGLVGALLTGVSYAKALAYAAKKPLLAVNHMNGHIAANYLTYEELEPPFLCLVVSGGHTELLAVDDYKSVRLLGETRDDAAGEAFDKIARVLGLPYPGGPELEKLGKEGNDEKYKFPRAFRGEEHLDYSFSGVKTAAINLLHRFEQTGEEFRKADVAASFEKSVVDTLLYNTKRAIEREGASQLVLAGGVAANARLRAGAEKLAGKMGVKLYLPEKRLCTDNAEMIGSAAYYTGKEADMTLNADPYM